MSDIGDVHLPLEIEKAVKSKKPETVQIGCSGDSVLRYSGGGETLFLKSGSVDGGIPRERDVISFLKGSLPVPEIRAYLEEGGIAFLLLSEMQGEMLCAESYLHDPETAVKILAQGLLTLWNMKTENCPLEGRLERKIQLASENVAAGKVDRNDWENSTKERFSSPEELLCHLEEKRPPEDLVLTHGDYCLPNIFGAGAQLSGFIDLGRAGVADRWQDIALCIRSMEFNFNTDKYAKRLLNHLDISFDKEKCDYYILLDEVF